MFRKVLALVLFVFSLSLSACTLPITGNPGDTPPIAQDPTYSDLIKEDKEFTNVFTQTIEAFNCNGVDSASEMSSCISTTNCVDWKVGGEVGSGFEIDAKVIPGGFNLSTILRGEIANGQCHNDQRCSKSTLVTQPGRRVALIIQWTEYWNTGRIDRIFPDGRILDPIQLSYRSRVEQLTLTEQTTTCDGSALLDTEPTIAVEPHMPEIPTGTVTIANGISECDLYDLARESDTINELIVLLDNYWNLNPQQGGAWLAPGFIVPAGSVFWTDLGSGVTLPQGIEGLVVDSRNLRQGGWGVFTTGINTDYLISEPNAGGRYLIKVPCTSSAFTTVPAGCIVTWNADPRQAVAAGAERSFTHCPSTARIVYSRIAVDDRLENIWLVCDTAYTPVMSEYFEQYADPAELLPQYRSTKPLDIPAGCYIEFSVRDEMGGNVGLTIESSGQ